MSLTPVTNALMGWRGAGGLGAAEMQVILLYYLPQGRHANLPAVVSFIFSVVF